MNHPLLVGDALVLIYRAWNNDSSFCRNCTVVPLLEISCGFCCNHTSHTCLSCLVFLFLLNLFFMSCLSVPLFECLWWLRVWCFSVFTTFTVRCSSLASFFRLFRFVSCLQPISTALPLNWGTLMDFSLLAMEHYCVTNHSFFLLVHVAPVLHEDL